MKLADELEALRRREVQMIGAGLSRRDWHSTEQAYNQLRDKIDGMLRATEAVEWEGPLTAEEQSMIDRAWEIHKAAGPASTTEPVEPDADNTPHRYDEAAPDTCRKCGNREGHVVHEPAEKRQVSDADREAIQAQERAEIVAWLERWIDETLGQDVDPKYVTRAIELLEHKESKP